LRSARLFIWGSWWNQATDAFTANVGHTYRVVATDDLTTRIWTPVDRDFVAANPTISITDYVSVPKRFYRVLLLD